MNKYTNNCKEIGYSKRIRDICENLDIYYDIDEIIIDFDHIFKSIIFRFYFKHCCRNINVSVNLRLFKRADNDVISNKINNCIRYEIMSPYLIGGIEE